MRCASERKGSSELFPRARNARIAELFRASASFNFEVRDQSVKEAVDVIDERIVNRLQRESLLHERTNPCC